MFSQLFFPHDKCALHVIKIKNQCDVNEYSTEVIIETIWNLQEEILPLMYLVCSACLVNLSIQYFKI